MNEDKAVQLSREAADRGHAVAQLKLGWELLGAKNKEKEQEGFRYIWLAAKQGLMDAEFILGDISSCGDEANLDEAKVWLARAAAKGHEQAKTRLAKLDA